MKELLLTVMPVFLASFIMLAGAAVIVNCSAAADQNVTRVTISGAYQAELTKCILDAQNQAEYKTCADAVDVRFGSSLDAGADR